MPSPVITLILDAKNLASPQLKGLQKDLKGAETNTAKMGAAVDRSTMLLKGLVTGGAIAAAYGLASALADGVQGAIEEERGIARLNAVLKANIPAWDGSTAAIDKATDAALRNGWSDDEVRDSLTKLIPATRNVSAALRVQQTAMDLARLKGISLVEASEALVKVEAGQYRALKSLGIVLRDGATATEALAAVQKVAAGQNAAYMETLAGKTESLNKRMDELSETIGGAVIPAMDGLSGVLVDAIAIVEGADVPFRNLITDLEALAGPLQPLVSGLGTVEDRMESAAAMIAASRTRLVEWRLAGGFARDTSDDLTEASGRLRDALRISGVTAQRTAGKFGLVNDQLSDMIDLAAVAEAGMRTLWNVANPHAFDWNPIGAGAGGRLKPKKKKKASGGWAGLDGPELTWVGEAGPEYVVPNHDLGGPSGGRTGATGGGGVTLIVNSAWPPTPSQAREFADMLDQEWAQRRPRYSPA